MTQAAKKQRKVIGRVGADGELHVIAEIVPFVSSRLGAERVSRETKRERDAEYRAVAVAVKQFGGAGE